MTLSQNVPKKTFTNYEYDAFYKCLEQDYWDAYAHISGQPGGPTPGHPGAFAKAALTNAC